MGMTCAPASRLPHTSTSARPQLAPSDASRDAPTSLAVHALVGWLMCQVGIILVVPWLEDAVQSHARLLLLLAFWLTFRHAFTLGALEDATLGACILGFEWFLQQWCGLPLSGGWTLVGLLWLTIQVDRGTHRRLTTFLWRRCYALLRASVYATTKTERLKSPYFSGMHRTLAALLEGMRRSCAHKLCTISQGTARRATGTRQGGYTLGRT